MRFIHMTGLSVNRQRPFGGPGGPGVSLHHRAALLQGHNHHLGLHGSNHLVLPPPTVRIIISHRLVFSVAANSLPLNMVGGRGARAFFIFFLLVGSPLPHASAPRRASALPTRPPLNHQHQGPAGLGPSIPLYMTLSSLVWAHFLFPGCSCLSLALLALSYPALHLAWFALVPVTFSDFILLQSTH